MSFPSVRYEIKIPCPLHHLAQVQAWVRLQAAHWRVAYPPRQVNNIYFDSDDYAGLRDNLDGVGMRRKLRLRWYGDDLTHVAAARLELKIREGTVGWKAICSLDGLTLDLSCQSWKEILAALRAADPHVGLWMSGSKQPVLINHYRRAYYATITDNLRLTVDSDLRAYDQRWSVRPNLRHPVPLADRGVVEFKADRQHYLQLLHALAAFPLRPDRHSKYVRGMLAAPDIGGWL